MARYDILCSDDCGTVLGHTDVPDDDAPPSQEALGLPRCVDCAGRYATPLAHLFAARRAARVAGESDGAAPSDG